MCILKLENVAYKYEGAKKNVFNKINIQFETGKIYVIMGRSGAGKSTLLSLLSGLDLCTEGTISYNGNSLKEIDRDDYRSKKIGVIFQGYNLLTNANAIENIILSMNISKTIINNKIEKAYDLLENVGIDKETANRRILKLSGGEQQRVGIARALSYNPDIIIADEPTGNLDSETKKIIMDIFNKIAHKENKCVIIVTHSKDVANAADELWGLNQGNLIFIK